MNTKDIIQNQIDTQENNNQFTVATVPFHVHNGSDSPNVNYKNIKSKYLTLPHTIFGTQAATSGNYSTFFTAPSAMTVISLTEVHAVKGTDGGAVSLDIEKLIGTTAPGSGVKITSSPFDLKGNINTVVSGSLSTTVGYVQLNAGDRLALLLTGTPTSVANVTVTLVINF